MSTIESQYTISGTLRSVVQTEAADELTLATFDRERKETRDAWDVVIDRRLIEWGKTPGILEDDGIVPPSPRVIRLASQLVMAMREQGAPAPLRVVPNGEGGVVFEREAGSLFQTIEIRADLSVEFASYRNARLVSRQRLA